MQSSEFEVKVDRSEIGKLQKFVENFPKCSWIDGCLEKPQEDVDGNTSKYIGYFVTSMRKEECKIISNFSIEVPEDSSLYKDYVDVSSRVKQPAFLKLVSGGFGSASQSLSAKKLASDFLGRGYVGFVRFAFSDGDYRRNDLPACCEVWVSKSSPFRVVWRWNETVGGKGEMIQPALTMFYSNGFRKVEQPVSAFT